MVPAPMVCRFESVAEMTEISRRAGFLSALTESLPSLSTGVFIDSTIVSSATTSSADSLVPSAEYWIGIPVYLNTYLHNTNCINNADADCYLQASMRMLLQDDRVRFTDDPDDSLSTMLLCYP